MDINPEYGPQDCVVSLGPLSAACRELVGWYDQLIAGDHPAIQELDRIITTLQLLPPVPGRIGRDIQLIINGGRHSTRDQIIGAVERLRSVSTHTPAIPQEPVDEPSTPRARRASRPRRRRTARANQNQLQLPGLEPDHQSTIEGAKQWRTS